MSSFRIRPRFKHSQKAEKEAVEEKIKSALEHNDSLTFAHLPDHIYIKIAPADQHFWSPQLHLSFEQEEDEVIIRGLYGPNPTLWAIFFFGYVALGILSIFFGMWGLSRLSLGLSSTVLWFVPVFIGLAIILYFFAQTGQKLGAQQMFDIHHFYEDTMENKINIS